MRRDNGRDNLASNVQERNSAAGFTLVEVLVALLVLALAMTAWQLRISAQLDSTGYLRDKTVALWVADNQLRYLQLAVRFDPTMSLTEQHGTTELAGHTWHWQATRPALALDQDAIGTTTLEQGPQPVVINVSGDSADAARSNPMATLTGVLDANTAQ